MPQLTISLDTEQFQRIQREAEHRQLTPEQLVKAILREHLQERRATLPELAEALETAPASQLPKLGELLALSGSPEAIRPLLIAYTKGSSLQKPSLYYELRALLGRYPLLSDSAWKAIQVCTVRTAPLIARQIKTSLGLPVGAKDGVDPFMFRESPTAAEIASLTALLSWQRTGDVARQAAQALHQIALTSPCLELRQALPYLRRAWHIRFAHPELLQALRAIEEATVLWKDLPLPAEGDDALDSHNLPVPVDNSR